MKAYLIDPFEMTISEVNYSGNYEEIYKLIDCKYFDCVNLGRTGDTIYIDDEGLINGKQQEFFKVKGYPTPLAGYGLVLGSDEEGDSVEPKISLEELRELVSFDVSIEFLWENLNG